MTGSPLTVRASRAWRLQPQPPATPASGLAAWPSAFCSAVVVACAALLAAGSAQAQLGPANCGPLSNAYGPFDYRTTRGNELFLVESAHFTPEMERLVRGRGKSLVGGDLDYTLRAFPNHHRALLAMMRLSVRERAAKPGGANYEMECYFVRATTFRPDDNVARMLFAKFLLDAKRRDEALRQLAVAQMHAGDNPFSHYNLGLSFLEAAQYDQSLKHAHQAMAMGFPRTELKDQLQAKGQWQEPSPPASAASAPVAAGSAASAP